MVWEVELSPRAKRDLGSLPTEIQVRVVQALHELGEEPYRASNVKKLKGEEGGYRRRVGDYRILYELHVDGRMVIYVVRITHRRDTYRRR